MSLIKNYVERDIGNPKYPKKATGLRKVQLVYYADAFVVAPNRNRAIQQVEAMLGAWERDIETEKVLWKAGCSLTLTSRVIVQVGTLKNQDVQRSYCRTHQPCCGHKFNDLLLEQLIRKREGKERIGKVDLSEIEERMEEELIFESSNLRELNQRGGDVIE